jgi:hypothetical protein
LTDLSSSSQAASEKKRSLPSEYLQTSTSNSLVAASDPSVHADLDQSVGNTDEGRSKKTAKPSPEGVNERGVKLTGVNSTSEEESGTSEVDAFEENFRELRKWVDTTLAKHALLVSKREKRAGRLGHALKVGTPVCICAPDCVNESIMHLNQRLYT